MKQKTKAWLSLLISALSGSVIQSLTNAMAAPQTFNLTTIPGVKLLLITAIVPGVIALFNKLQDNPFPGVLKAKGKEGEK